MLVRLAMIAGLASTSTCKFRPEEKTEKVLHLAGGEVLLPNVNLHFRLHLVNITWVQFCLGNNLVLKEQIETLDWLCVACE